MGERNNDFMVDETGKPPKNLREAISKVKKSSEDFVKAWSEHDDSICLSTSNEAFENLDYIQNELLRRRDAQQKNKSTWAASPLKKSLAENVGQIFSNISATQIAWYRDLPAGNGALPPGSVLEPLTLETALNKLKHRDPIGVNFTISSKLNHTLYVFATAGMSKPDTLSELDIQLFCDACLNAVNHV